jgi:hypothetical protein
VTEAGGSVEEESTQRSRGDPGSIWRNRAPREGGGGLPQRAQRRGALTQGVPVGSLGGGGFAARARLGDRGVRIGRGASLNPSAHDPRTRTRDCPLRSARSLENELPRTLRALCALCVDLLPTHDPISPSRVAFAQRSAGSSQKPATRADPPSPRPKRPRRAELPTPCAAARSRRPRPMPLRSGPKSARSSPASSGGSQRLCDSNHDSIRAPTPSASPSRFTNARALMASRKRSP